MNFQFYFQIKNKLLQRIPLLQVSVLRISEIFLSNYQIENAHRPPTEHRINYLQTE